MIKFKESPIVERPNSGRRGARSESRSAKSKQIEQITKEAGRLHQTICC